MRFPTIIPFPRVFDGSKINSFDVKGPLRNTPTDSHGKVTFGNTAGYFPILQQRNCPE